MQKNKLRIFAIAAALAAVLWVSGAVPKQIAFFCGSRYVAEHFPQMELRCTDVEWSKAHGDYLIYFEAADGSRYSCVIGPRLLPVSLGQGLNAIAEDYAAQYES